MPGRTGTDTATALSGPAPRTGLCRAFAMRVRIALATYALAAVLQLAAQDTGAVLGYRLSLVIPTRMISDVVPGAFVVVLEDGAPVWTRAFGLAEQACGRPMTEDALFDLDAPVTGCLTDWHPLWRLPSITPRQILSNTDGIGLGDYAERYAPDAPRRDLATHLAGDLVIISPPGTRFAYSDTGQNLLELVIEACTGQDVAALLHREVLVPLGMTGASFDWIAAEVPSGHDVLGRPVAPCVYPWRASGGLNATAADAITEMHCPVAEVGGLFGFAADGYCLGHFTETLSDGLAAVWHGGQGYGWMSHLHLVPKTGDGIVILANSQRAWPLFAVILRVWSESFSVVPGA